MVLDDATTSMIKFTEGRPNSPDLYQSDYTSKSMDYTKPRQKKLSPLKIRIDSYYPGFTWKNSGIERHILR
jgi:hypothetical protein